MFVKRFFTALVVFLGIDIVWLAFAAKNFYDKQLSSFKRTTRILPAFLSYLLLVLGIVVLALPKANNRQTAFLSGALFGIISYGVYDLVNLATLSEWTVKMTVVDMIWGGVLCGTVTMITFILLK